MLRRTFAGLVGAQWIEELWLAIMWNRLTLVVDGERDLSLLAARDHVDRGLLHPVVHRVSKEVRQRLPNPRGIPVAVQVAGDMNLDAVFRMGRRDLVHSRPNDRVQICPTTGDGNACAVATAREIEEIGHHVLEAFGHRPNTKDDLTAAIDVTPNL